MDVPVAPPEEAKEGEVSQEEFFKLSDPKIFTHAVADSTDYRPAAVLTICNFLNKLSAKCRQDLHKFGCLRPHHTATAVSTTYAAQSNKTQHKHHHHRESWEKRMIRLKIYQRAFSSIVMYFKAYCPALFYIKKSYEDMLNYRINQIKTAHFEKKRLHIQKHNMKHQMAKYVFPEYYQLLKSEKYLGILRQRISLQEEAIKVITDILKKMEEALSDHFERHRDLEEQIVMVDTEIANRRQKAFSMREKEEKETKEQNSNANDAEAAAALMDSDEEDKEDPFYNTDVEEIDEERRMVWIMAFAICHKDLEDAEKRIQMFQTKYQFVVPRHEHESMKRSIIDEKAAAKVLADEKSALEDELANLKELEVKLDEELTQVKEQLAELRTLVTPRPSWEQLGEFVQGGVPKWTKMIQGKSTKDAADKLVAELRSRRGGDKFLQPLGTEHTVLRCLRHGKKVADRQLHSRDAAIVIHDIWQERKKALEENFNAPKNQDDFDFGKTDAHVATKGFADFVAIYFEERYEDAEQRMEWTYNLVECCKRFSLDYRLTNFLNILQGRSDEGIYFITQNELFRVRNTFLEKSVQEGMTGGILSSNQYVEALEVAFPQKAEPEVQSIVRVTNKLNAELNSEEGADLSVYHITQLMDMRDDGFRGALVGELVKQFEVEKQNFVDKVIEQLALMMDISPAAASSETDPSGNKDVDVVMVYSAIKRSDGDLGDEHIGAAMTWIFTQTSVLPGGGITTGRLVNYAKLHAGEDNEESKVSVVPTSSDIGAMDEEKFERAIKDIVREEEDPDKEGEPQMSESQKKAFYRSLRTAKLRTVVKRLRGSALLPSTLMYNPKESLLPEGPVDLETDLEELKKQVAEAKAPPPSDMPALDMDEDGLGLHHMEGEDEDDVSVAPTTDAPAPAPAAPPPAATATPSATESAI